MKITVYSLKGSAGKTPIAVNIALEHGYAIWTNEPYHVLDSFIPEERLLSVDPEEAFPDIPDDIDIVFDLAGSISRKAKSITSAIKQSDVVLVPIYNEIKSINAGIHTIAEVARFTKNIAVVATKISKKARTKGPEDGWLLSIDCSNIKKMVEANIDFEVPVLPLKFSKGFDAIFEKEKSIRQLMKSNPLNRFAYREIAQQFDDLYSFIQDHYAK